MEEPRSFCASCQLQKVLLEVLLLDGKPGGWNACIDHQAGKLIGTLNRAWLFDHDRFIPHREFVASVVETELSSFKVARFDFQAPGTQLFERVCIQFFDQSPSVNNTDACGQPVHFREDVTRHED